MDEMLVSPLLIDEEPFPALPRCESSSTISLSSPSPCLPAGINLDEPFYVEAFCTFNNMSIVLEYPREYNGWVYRPEVGGHSQHRWDMANAVSVIARHSTCKKAISVRNPCRNCVMKKIWRRECIDPCNSFFVKAIGTVDDCISSLMPFVYDSTPLSQGEVS